MLSSDQRRVDEAGDDVVSEWVYILSEWTGIRSETLVPLLVFGLVVVLIVIGFLTVAVVLIVRSGRGQRSERTPLQQAERPDNPPRG